MQLEEPKEGDLKAKGNICRNDSGLISFVSVFVSTL